MAYNNNGYNRQYNGRGPNFNNQNRQSKRKNGAKFGYNKNSDPYITGWKIINGELVSFYCSVNPNVGVEIVTNKEGKEYQKWLCTVSYPKSAKRDELFTGFYNPDKKTVTIPDINLFLAPNANVSSGKGGVWFTNS